MKINMDNVTIKISLVSMVSEIKDLTPEERLALAKDWYDWVMEGERTASVHSIGVVQ